MEHIKGAVIVNFCPLAKTFKGMTNEMAFIHFYLSQECWLNGTRACLGSGGV